MGGFGSGRPRSGRRTAEDCLSLGANQLHKRGCLSAGWSGGWRWTRGDEQVGSASLRAERDRLHLSYRIRDEDGDDWEDVTEAIGIVHVPCHLGGTRPYLTCPGVVDGVACRRRVGKLYQAGRYFLCRHCSRLTHASQGEDECDRALRRARKLRRRLGGDPDEPFPPKPKGMWGRTYERSSEQASEAELRADEAFIASSSRLLARVANHQRNRRCGKGRPGSFWR